MFELKPTRGTPINKTHPLAKGLVGYWVMNEGTGSKVYDLSGNGNTGTLTNMTEAGWVAGRRGTALDFDGTNDAVTVDSVDTLKIINAVTVSAWIKRLGTGGQYAYLAYKGSDASGDVDYGLGGNNDNTAVRLFVRTSGGNIDISAPVTTGVWEFWAGTYDGTTGILYKNGVEVASAVRAGTINTSDGPFHIGWSEFSTAKRTFNGQIDDVRIYNRALSASEITSLYSDPYQFLRPPATNPAIFGGLGGGGANYTATVTESLSLTDTETIVRTPTEKAAVSENLSITDNLSSSEDYTIAVTESLSLTDNVSSGFGDSLSVSETLALTDTAIVARTPTEKVSISETLSLTDDIAVVEEEGGTDYTVSVTETLALDDSLNIAKNIIYLVSTSTANSAAVGSGLSITKPTGMADGDVMISFIHNQAGDSITSDAPTGFINISNGNTATETDRTYSVSYKIITDAASEPASYTWSGIGADRAWSLMVFRNVDVDDIIAGGGGLSDIGFVSNWNGAANPSITTDVDNAMLVFGLMLTDNAVTAFSPPTGMTEQVEILGLNRNQTMATAIQSDKGVTGTKTFTATGVNTTEDGIFISLALRPIVTDKYADITESLGLTDSALLSVERSSSREDTLNLSDATETAVTIPLTESETLNLTDSVSFVQTGTSVATITESLTLSDSQTFLSRLSQAILDTLGLSDSVSVVHAEFETTTITESLTLSDSQTFLSRLSQAISDTINLTDSISVIKTGAEVIAVTEGLILSDSQTLVSILSQTITETVSLTDLVSIVSDGGEVVAVTETLILTDAKSLVSIFSQITTDTLTLTDKVLRSGWDYITKNTDAIWTTVSKSTDAIWATVSKATDSTWNFISKNN